MNDNTQRDVLEQISAALNGAEKPDSYNATVKIPTLCWDFHMAVEKLSDMKSGMDNPRDIAGLSARDQADAFISGKIISCVLEKTDAQLKADYGTIHDITVNLNVHDIAAAAIEFFEDGDHGNDYLKDRASERLDMWYNNFGTGGVRPNSSNDTMNCPDYAHCVLPDEVKDRIDENDNIAAGTDRHNTPPAYEIRTIGPDAESFITSIPQPEKIEMLREYLTDTKEQDVAKSENARVDAWLADVYKDSAREITSREDATGNDLEAAAGWLEKSADLSGGDRTEQQETYARAAEAYDKEGMYEDAFRTSHNAGGHVDRDTRLSYADKAIGEIVTEHYLDDAKDPNALTLAIEETHDTDVIRENLTLSDSETDKHLSSLLDQRDAVAEGRDPFVDKDSTVPEKDAIEENSQENTVDADTETKTETDTEPDTPSAEEKNTDTENGYRFQPGEITEADVEAAAKEYIDLLNNESYVDDIRAKLGDEAADRFTDAMSDMAAAIVTEDHDKFLESKETIDDIRQQMTADKVDIGLDTSDVIQNTHDDPDATADHEKEALLKEYLELGQRAYIDPNNNRRMNMNSRNPFHLRAVLEYDRFVYDHGTDKIKEITGHDVPAVTKWDLLGDIINFNQSYTFSNISAAYSEALYQALLKEKVDKNSDDKQKLIEKTRKDVITYKTVGQIDKQLQNPDSELAVAMKQKLGVDYDLFRDAISKGASGDRHSIDKASFIADRHDSPVGGRNRNERFDRRDAHQNMEIYREVRSAWKEGREITIQVPGLGKIEGPVTRRMVFWAGMNILHNSDYLYTVFKGRYDESQESFFTVFDEKKESVAELIEKSIGGGVTKDHTAIETAVGAEARIESNTPDSTAKPDNVDQKATSWRETLDDGGWIAHTVRPETGRDERAYYNKDGEIEKKASDYSITRNDGRVSVYNTQDIYDKNGVLERNREIRVDISTSGKATIHGIERIFHTDRDGNPLVDQKNRPVCRMENDRYTDIRGTKHDVDKNNDEKGERLSEVDLQTNSRGETVIVERDSTKTDVAGKPYYSHTVEYRFDRDGNLTGKEKYFENGGKADNVTSERTLNETDLAGKQDPRVEKDHGDWLEVSCAEYGKNELSKDNANLDVARAYLETADDKADKKDWEALGDKFEKSGRIQDAVESWEKAGVDAHEDKVETAHATLGREELSKDAPDLDKAMSHIDSAGDKAEKADHDALCDKLEAAGRHDDAVSHRDAYETRQAELGKEELAKEDPDIDKAKAHLDTAGDKADSADREALGDRLESAGRHEEALEQWEKAGVDAQEDKVENAHAAIGKEELNKDNPDIDKVDREFSKAGDKIDTDDYEKLGDKYYEAGNNEKAVENWEKSGIDPDSEKYKEALSRTDLSERYENAIESARNMDLMFDDEKPENADQTYTEAAEAMLSQHDGNPTGNEIKQAAEWYESGHADPKTVEETHAKACEAYLSEGYTYNAYKEAVAAKDNIPSEIKDSAVEAYAKASLQSARDDTGTYVRAARLFDLLPAEKRESPEAMEAFEKGACQIERSHDTTKADIDKAISWADRVPGFDSEVRESLEAKADHIERNYEDFSKELIEPAVQDAVSRNEKIDFGKMYEEIREKLAPYYPSDTEYTPQLFAEEVENCISQLDADYKQEDTTIESSPDSLDAIRDDLESFRQEDRYDVEINEGRGVEKSKDMENVI